jgi:Rrf2 family protein
VDAKTLSELTSVTPRFTLKILNKLVLGGLINSYKGVKGGYKLKKEADAITLKSVIELIDGPIVIARCLEHNESCTMISDKSACVYHHIFESISLDVSKRLSNITIKDILSRNFSVV